MSNRDVVYGPGPAGYPDNRAGQVVMKESKLITELESVKKRVAQVGQAVKELTSKLMPIVVPTPCESNGDVARKEIGPGSPLRNDLADINDSLHQILRDIDILKDIVDL